MFVREKTVLLKPLQLTLGLMAAFAPSGAHERSLERSPLQACGFVEQVLPSVRAGGKIYEEDGNTIVEFQDVPHPPVITFRIPIDCQGKIIAPDSLHELSSILEYGLSRETMIEIARLFAMVEGFDRERKTTVDEGDIRQFETFLAESFMLRSRGMQRRIACTRAENRDWDMSALFIYTSYTTLLRTDEELVDNSQSRQLFKLSKNIMDRCDSSPTARSGGS